MKHILFAFLLLPVLLVAQYPSTGNKQRLGYQTTGDGLIWRGVAADTAIKPRTTANAYFQLDTINGILRRYIATRGSWQTVSGGGGSGLTMPFDSITFNPTTADPDTAELKYNADLETFIFGADGTVIEIGQKAAWYVKNQSGSTIPKGTVVRAAGTLGSSGRILIEPMEIDGTVDSKYLLGITASNISNGSDGYVIDFGKLRKFNTSAWSDGDVLYADDAGGLTNVEPNPPNLRLPIAFVVHDHATNGVLAIRIQTGNELHELHDVDTTGINNGNTIVWDGSKWVPSDVLTPADSATFATKYWTGQNFFPLEGGTLTGTGGAGFIGFPSQVSAPGTPSSGLNVYAQGSSFNWKGTDGYERQFGGTITGGRSYTLPDVNGTLALGTGTADRLARWTATNTLAAGNLSDNGTRLAALLPWQFQTYTTAGLPTGVTGYHLYNTTTNGPAWYQGSRWAYGLESTFNRGTATRIPFFDANGQVTDNAGYYRSAPITWSVSDVDFSGFASGESSTKYGGMFWRNSAEELEITTNNSQEIHIISGSSYLGIRDATNTRYDAYITGARTIGLGLIRDADFYGMEMGESPTKTGGFYWRNTLERLNITTFGNGFPIEFGNNWMYMETNGRIGVGNTSPQRTFHITGEARITDLTTDPPTQIVGADADGDLGALALSGLSISGGTLTGQNIGNTDLTLSGNRTLTGAGYWLKYPNMEFNIGDTTWLFSKGVRPYLYGRSKTYKPGRDSVAGQIILSTNGPQASLQLYGSANAGNNFSGAIFLYDQSANTAKNKGWFIANDQRDVTENGLNFKQVGTGASGFVSHYIMRNNGTFTVGNPTYSPVMAVAHDTFMIGKLPIINENIAGNAAYAEAPFKVVNLGTVGSPSSSNQVIATATVQFSQYGVGSKEAADLSKTQSNYIAGFATDGTLLDYPISSLANGIYSGSGTLSQTTTRARIPDNGNLYFGQRFNSNADSAYWYIANYGDGERELAYGITDTASTGFAGATFYSDGAGEMNWELETAGASGTTSVKAQDGTFSVTTSGGNMSLNAGVGNEVAVVGLVKAKQEAYSEVTSTTSPVTLSNTYSDNLINQGGTQATFTLEMPASPEDGQICTITFNNAISTLTIDGNGETIVGSAVTTGVPGSQRKFKFYSGIGWIKLY